MNSSFEDNYNEVTRTGMRLHYAVLSSVAASRVVYKQFSMLLKHKVSTV